MMTMMNNDSISVASSSFTSSSQSSQSSSLNRSSSYLMNSSTNNSGGAVTPPSSSAADSPVLRTARRHRRAQHQQQPSQSQQLLLLLRPRAKSCSNMIEQACDSSASSSASSSAASTRPASLFNSSSSAAAAAAAAEREQQLQQLNASLAEQNKQLIFDLFEARRELKQRELEVEKLIDTRNRLESEMQELSASLFEQAYSMVNSARAEKAQSEKLLKEANGKIEVLEAEVKALKELVLNSSMTSSSSTPNNKQTRTLHHSRQSSLNQQTILTNSLPTTSTPSNQASSSTNLSSSDTSRHVPQPDVLRHSATFTQPLSASLQSKEKPPVSSSKHRRLPSDQAKSFIDKLFHHSSSSSALNGSQKSSSGADKKSFTKENKCESLERSVAIDTPNNIYEQEAVEHDVTYYEELAEWRKKPELDAEASPFLTRIYTEDIQPCLNFNNPKTTDELLESILQNCVCIEDISNQSADQSLNKMCGLSKVPSICQYKIKLSENGEWIYISRLTRNRIISVCDFFTYLRYIKDGLVKSDINEIYWNIIDLRRKMSLSRLGL